MTFLARNWLLVIVLSGTAASVGWSYLHSPAYLCDGSRTHTITFAGYQACPNHGGGKQ